MPLPTLTPSRRSALLGGAFFMTGLLSLQTAEHRNWPGKVHVWSGPRAETPEGRAEARDAETARWIMGLGLVLILGSHLLRPEADTGGGTRKA